MNKELLQKLINADRICKQANVHYQEAVKLEQQDKPQQAEVSAVGPGGVVDGKEVKMEVKVGDQVIYSKYAGTEVKLDEEEYIIVKQNDILAVIE